MTGSTTCTFNKPTRVIWLIGALLLVLIPSGTLAAQARYRITDIAPVKRPQRRSPWRNLRQ